MTTLIIITAYLSIFHFLYEAIILPSIRLYLRNQLFELRDRIRSLKIEGLNKDDEQAFWFVHNGINNFLTRIPKLTLYKLYEIQTVFKNNTDLAMEAESRLNILSQSSNDEIKIIFKQTNNVLKKAFVANSGAWLLYLIPVFVLVSSMKKITTIIKALLLTPRNRSLNIFESENTYV